MGGGFIGAAGLGLPAVPRKSSPARAHEPSPGGAFHLTESGRCPASWRRRFHSLTAASTDDTT